MNAAFGRRRLHECSAHEIEQAVIAECNVELRAEHRERIDACRNPFGELRFETFDRAGIENIADHEFIAENCRDNAFEPCNHIIGGGIFAELLARGRQSCGNIGSERRAVDRESIAVECDISADDVINRIGKVIGIELDVVNVLHIDIGEFVGGARPHDVAGIEANDRRAVRADAVICTVGAVDIGNCNRIARAQSDNVVNPIDVVIFVVTDDDIEVAVGDDHIVLDDRRARKARQSCLVVKPVNIGTGRRDRLIGVDGGDLMELHI